MFPYIKKKNLKSVIYELYVVIFTVTGKHLQHCIDRLASSDDSHRTDVSSKSNRLTVILPSAYDQGLFSVLQLMF